MTGTSASDAGLSANTQYCYQVSAVDAAGNESGKSVQQCATTLQSSDTTAPSIPANLSAMAASSSQINLGWSASTDNVGVTGYKLYRGTQYLKTVTGTSASDAGLSANTQYCYQVSAVDAAGNESGKSVQQCATTLKAAPVLTGPSSATGSITLTWTYQWGWLASNQDGYQLQESSTSASSGFVQIFSSNGQGVADTQSPKTYSLTRSAGTYYYRVKAVVAGISTDWSNIVTVTVSAPTNATLTVNPSVDNTLIYSTTDAARANTVSSTGDISVGCNWMRTTVYDVDGNPVNFDDWICAAIALKFDIQTQIAGRTIVNAKLRLYPYILPADWDTTYAASAFAGAWNTSIITWNNQPSHFQLGQSTVNPPTSTAVPLELDVKTIVQNWANGTWVNNGILIRDTTMIIPGYTALRSTSFYSMNFYSTTAKRPELYLEYR